MECHLLLAMEHATLFLLVSYFALGIQMIIENVSRKLKEIFYSSKLFSRYNGVRFKIEQSSQWFHELVYALGSYRGSPFVTGTKRVDQFDWGLKTEIFHSESTRKWIQVADYPFSNGNR